jgi:hypothetical protein
VVAGFWQTEFYGAGFSLLYVVLLSQATLQPRWRATVLASIFLFVAIGFKEPFVLSNLAASLVLLRTRTQFWRLVCIPLAIVTLSGILALALLGALDGYLHVYLPEMFGSYIHRHYFPLWQRGLALDQFAAHLSAYVGLLAMVVGTLVYSAYHRIPESVTARTALMTHCLGFGLSVFFALALSQPTLLVHSGVVLGGVLVLSGCGIFCRGPLENHVRRAPLLLVIALLGLLLLSTYSTRIAFIAKQPVTILLVTGITLVCTYHVVKRWSNDERQGFGAIGILFGALFIAIASVAIGNDFQGHHFVVAVPLYCALLFSLVKIASKNGTQTLWIPKSLAIAALAGLVFFPSFDAEHRRAETKSVTRASRAIAAQIDALLDGCGGGRYIAIANELPYYGFTRHSPANFFLWAGFDAHWYRSATLRQRTLENLETADILIRDPNAQEPVSFVAEYLAKNFTNNAPACAKDFVVDGQMLLFRRSLSL